ncbi:MAG: DUF72 domain-containing protein [Polyangiaceae bacterium]|nr:DUF72 domain-containing protein [Polyangiaceae bacterium]
MPGDFDLAVEFRHASWFASGTLSDRAFAVLQKHRAGAVITDVAGRRDVCHAALPVPFVMVRFVGNNLHPTDFPRVDAWIARLVEWRSLGLGRAYFFAHQPDDGFAPETLAHFTTGARAAGVHIPEATIEPPPSPQLAFFGASAAPETTPSKKKAARAPTRR